VELLVREKGSQGEKSALQLVRHLVDSDSDGENVPWTAQLAALNLNDPEAPIIARVDAFLDLRARLGVPVDAAVALMRGLRRKFPSATAEQRTRAATRLFTLWARFDDWMGAVSLLRAIPTQRNYDITSFTDGLSTWLSEEEDLFDALRSFSRLENGGERTVAEVLQLLQSETRLESATDSAAAGRPTA